MIDAGIPILRCLGNFGWVYERPGPQETIETVAGDVKGRIALNEALAKHPKVFSRLYVNMIRAAELGGILDQILDA